MGSGQKIKYFLIAKMARFLINFVCFTCRKRFRGLDIPEELEKAGKPVIYIFWHRHIFFNIYRFRGSGARPLISHSTDGEIVSRIAVEFGMDPIRGSSSKGGARAFLKMVRSIRENNSRIMITADGPKGPPREIKDGTVLISAKTGAVIIPVSWYGSGVKIFEKSWDRFMIPKPFSTILFRYGDPIHIPADMEKEEYEKYKNTLKVALDSLEETIRTELEPEH